MSEILGNIRWEDQESDDMESMWSFFKDSIQSVVEECIPTSSGRSILKKKDWLNNEALQAIKEKSKAWKKYCNCKNEVNYRHYTEKRNSATMKCRLAKKNFERKLCENVKEDPKSFWKYIRSKSKTKSSIGDIEQEDGSLTSDNIRKAELFNRFFCAVFTNENTDNLPYLDEREFSNELRDILVTPELVKSKLLKLNPSKSPGEDQIHPRILKENADALSVYISFMFNKSLSSAQLPDDWRTAIVVPLHKKDSKKLVGNFRPVSLTSIVCKLLESIVRDAILHHMETNNLFSDTQHGFRNKKSCVTQLLEVIEDWCDIIDRGGNIDSIYLDFQKAFDTVPHKRLLSKLSSYGLRGRLLSWIEHFLVDRSQSVKVGTANSAKSKVISGIPQGSALGPILFLIYINDLPDLLSSTVILFADDTKIYSEVDGPDDCGIIQEDLNKLSLWSDKWLLRFNASKCKSLHLGRRNPNNAYVMPSSEGVQVQIQKTDQEKDLGVIFDNNMKFDVHIANIVKKANQRLGLIRRSFEYMDSEMFLILYKSLVRPILEYATVIWSPWLRKDQIAIEQVQRRATKLVKDIQHLSYEERLLRLGLPTLIYRRERADMVQLFKILEKFDEVHLSTLNLRSNSYTRGHDSKLLKRHFRYRSSMNCFTARCANPWNELPSECVHSNSVNTFKSRLNSAWKQKPNKFLYNF